MYDNAALKIIDRFQFIVKRLGADYPTLRLILAFKLAMDRRRVPTIVQDSRKNSSQLMSPFIKSLFLYALYGFIFIPFLVIDGDYLIHLTIVFTMMMFILMTSMVSDFSSVLLDVRDHVILKTKPVDERTQVLVKLLHVVIYIVQIAGAFLVIPLMVSLFIQGPVFFLLFFVSSVLITILSIVLTAVFYVTVLKFFDGEKLRNLINGIQIILTLGIFVGYQFVAHAANLMNITADFTMEAWYLLMPPIWFSNLFEIVLADHVTALTITGGMLAIVVPIVGLVLYIRFMRSFEQNLQKLMAQSGEHKNRLRAFWYQIAKLVTRDHKERAMFMFSRSMMLKEQEFKLKVYPTLGLSLILPIIFLLNPAWNQIEYMYLIPLYFTTLFIPTVVYMLKYSNKSEGAWVYFCLPVQNKRLFYRATLKAFIVQFFVPLIVFLGLFYYIVIGSNVLIHVLIVFLVGNLSTVISYRILNYGIYPFSKPFSVMESANTGLMIMSMFIIVLFALIHWLLISLFVYGAVIYFALLVVSHLMAWRYII
ncbi:hypothetical protein SAMN05421734_104130 [Pelagirhabdus alkalitolerans]|uniref:ABC-2 type transport system permease protein n=1 Tax=Pelagirhabdus alkalitolerans TaxID=1612202 RepID=A0A1G6ITD5_9BACI|nr:hypothetical protein [Pelagirhabdus alkalitolerans]SDC09724.1 hypothetical protein SAMN05421734_104130 [Pelagirhabdus alkalitolerans]